MRARSLCTWMVMFSFVLVTLLPSNVALAQPQAAGSGLSQPFVLQDGTPLKLRLNRNLSSADAHTGDQVDFEVLEEVKVNNVLIIPKGANASRKAQVEDTVAR